MKMYGEIIVRNTLWHIGSDKEVLDIWRMGFQLESILNLFEENWSRGWKETKKIYNRCYDLRKIRYEFENIELTCLKSEGHV